ncbi:MAG: hypothetical protein Q7T07_00415 [Burkholderiaceae bacterium]|nr:hypothetical protein [Burkholderiaceae bacterium]
MKSLSYSVVVVIGLAGCAAAPDLPSTYVLDASQPEGLAIVSLTLTGKRLDRISAFTFRLREIAPGGEEFAVVRPYHASLRQQTFVAQSGNLDRRLTGRIVVKGPSATDALDISNNGLTTGRLVTLRLSPGDYEIHSWELRESSLSGEVEYSPPRDFSYRFSVRPGTVSYIGRLNLYMGPRNTQRVSLQDMRYEDLALFGKKYPLVPIEAVSFDTSKPQR